MVGCGAMSIIQISQIPKRCVGIAEKKLTTKIKNGRAIAAKSVRSLRWFVFIVVIRATV